MTLDLHSSDNLSFINFNQFTSQWIGQGRSSLQLLVSARTGQDAPSYWAGVETSLPLRLCPGPPQLQDFEQELQALQPLIWVVLSYAFPFSWRFTWQSIGQGKSLQLFAFSRTGQGVPLCWGWISTTLPLRLCPELHVLEHELHKLQALTWVCYWNPELL